MKKIYLLFPLFLEITTVNILEYVLLVLFFCITVYLSLSLFLILEGLHYVVYIFICYFFKLNIML